MKDYYIENRITKEIVKIAADSAQEACQKAGWLIGDCWVFGVRSLSVPIPNIGKGKIEGACHADR